MPTIYGYHADVPDLVRMDELKLVTLFRHRWEDAGWTPFILNEWIAMKHPYFEEYNRAISALPSVNPDGYERACWMRHLALAQVGGGYMADTDLIHYPVKEEITLAEMEAPRLQMFDLHTPSLIYASKEVAEKLCREFASGKWGKRDIGGREHYSDMYALEDLGAIENDGTMADPERYLIEHHDLVRNYGTEGWETAPFVHYSKDAMARADKLPKWRHIPKLR